MEDTIKTIINAVSDITHRAFEEISPATRLAEDLSLKSIARIELAAFAGRQPEHRHHQL